MLALQQAKPVFPSKPGKNRAVVEGRLSGQIDLRRPPCGNAELEFCPEGVEVVAAALGAESGKIFHLQTAGLFKVMVVGHDVRTLLRPDWRRQAKKQRENQDRENETGKFTPDKLRTNTCDH